MSIHTITTDVHNPVVPAHSQPCPLCGVPCDHTPDQMQGFALDALAEAGRLLNEGKL